MRGTKTEPAGSASNNSNNPVVCVLCCGLTNMNHLSRLYDIFFPTFIFVFNKKGCKTSSTLYSIAYNIYVFLIFFFLVDWWPCHPQSSARCRCETPGTARCWTCCAARPGPWWPAPRTAPCGSGTTLGALGAGGSWRSRWMRYMASTGINNQVYKNPSMGLFIYVPFLFLFVFFCLRCHEHIGYKPSNFWKLLNIVWWFVDLVLDQSSSNLPINGPFFNIPQIGGDLIIKRIIGVTNNSMALGIPSNLYISTMCSCCERFLLMEKVKVLKD